MTRAAVTKLFILVTLAFIICLPEFFTLYRVNFRCLPRRRCERGGRVRRGGDAQAGPQDLCDPWRAAELEPREQACVGQEQGNATDFWTDGQQAERKLFLCEADTDMAELTRNMSSAGVRQQVEVSLELHLSDVEISYLTMYAFSNRNVLREHPYEDEEEEEGRKRDEGRRRKASYCCLPGLSASEASEQSCCLLLLANHTVWAAAAKEKLPWKQTTQAGWRCVLRVVWLLLICVVLLTVLTAVLRKIYKGRYSSRKLTVHPLGYQISGQQPTDAERNVRNVNPRADMLLHSRGSWSWAELSPIQEVCCEDDVESLLDDSGDQCFTENLPRHGRPSLPSLPFLPSLSEEPAW